MPETRIRRSCFGGIYTEFLQSLDVLVETEISKTRSASASFLLAKTQVHTRRLPF